MSSELRVGDVVRVISTGRVGVIRRVRRDYGGYLLRARVGFSQVVEKWVADGDLELASLLDQIAWSSR